MEGLEELEVKYEVLGHKGQWFMVAYTAQNTGEPQYILVVWTVS